MPAAAWLHVVDLDGAFAGRPVNGAAVEAILAAVEVPVQLGGGIRDRAAIEAWLGKGVRRVILGTVALRDPGLVRAAAAAHPGRIAVGIDARGGRVAVEGWAETSDVEAVDLARRFEDAGVAAIVYTDIDRDGALEGPNVPGDGGARARRLDPGDRLGRHRLARRPAGAEGGRRAARRRDLRARALRGADRPRRGGAAAGGMRRAG